MDRIEKLRGYVDDIILKMDDGFERRCAYLHLYGVAQACAMIALKRNENAELATIAGMLHDIYTYAKMDSVDHAHKGAALAREILEELDILDAQERESVCKAIYNHSDKKNSHASFDEVLIDADVLQHCLYNSTFEVMEHEKERFEKLKLEFGLSDG